jgi:Undecaprenyl-phosphate glucose phosphotransferase
MKQILRFNKIIKSIIITGDLCILNALFVTLYYVLDTDTQRILLSDSLPQLLVLLNLVYLLCNYSKGVVLHRRIVRADHIVMRAVRNTFCHAVVFISLITLVHFGSLSTRFLIIFYTTFLVLLVLYRLIFRHFVKIYRRKGGNRRTVALVGDGSNMVELYEEMTADPTSGFKVVGYFAEHPSDNYPKECCYLGTPQEVIPYLKKSKAEQLYCGLASSHSKEILPIISYCENNLIHFYSVPNVRNYLKRRMHLELIGNVPVLDIRQEPLAQPENRLAKRLFDIVFSLLFLCTIFPIIFIIIGLAIKITSPGPIFFKQKRSGEGNKEFWCYKFRSMRVNKDSDKVQATLNDPRKTRLGNFMRKTSIDELPQFINVLLGDMSVVGPRPHMLKHTEEYSKLIDKYMVRHLVKPGITGWAQVTGFRGETKELWQMEGRVERDIWYLEHWTFMLDLYIIYKTVKNAVKGEKEAY